MSKPLEISYLHPIGEAGTWHAAHKPFSDPACHRYLIGMGAVMSLLLQPPATVLDLGCGTGWTSVFLARRGYEVTGVDISTDMIFQANQNKQRARLPNLRFVVADYENLSFGGMFDVALFYGSLHQAVDARQAIAGAYRALKTGGICLTLEAGRGHVGQATSLAGDRNFGVAEKDMPIRKVFALGRHAGFRDFRAYPDAAALVSRLYGTGKRPKPFFLFRALLALLSYYRTDNGVCVMVK
jgi:SAM-dependent methyltransferase